MIPGYVSPTEIIAGDDILGAWTATGENGSPFTFTADRALPQGLSLSPEGKFSGSTNSAPMEWKGSVTATDRTGKKSAPVAWEFNILHRSTSIVVTPTTYQLPDAVVGQPYLQQLLVSGGTAPYTFPSSDLGHDLSLNSTGLIIGTPRQAGAIDFTNFVRDARGYMALFGYTISIRPAQS
jgi:hypothetical protein